MWDILIIGGACLGSGVVAGLLINVGRGPDQGRELAQAKAELADAKNRMKVDNNRIERMRGDLQALAAENEELKPLADLGRKTREAREKQNVRKKEVRHARGLKRPAKG